MCHTLLQHYIPCRHTTVHFISCSPSDDPSGRRPHPNYAQSNVEIHAYQLSAEVSDTATESLPVTPEEAARWRDHSVPRGIAHSYHRLCPTCLDEKIAEDKLTEMAERRALGGENWRNWARAAEAADAAEESGRPVRGPDGRVEFVLRTNAAGGEYLQRVEGGLETVDDYSDDDDDDDSIGGGVSLEREVEGAVESARTPGAETSINILERRRDLLAQLERLPTRGSDGLAQARVLLAELETMEMLLEGTRFAVPRYGMPGRRVPGADGNHIIQPRLPDLPIIGAGHGNGSGPRPPGDSSRGLRQLEVEQLMHARLGQRVQARRAQQRQRLETTRQTAAARRMRMFEEAQQNERRMIQNASDVIGNDNAPDSDRVEAQAVIERLASAPPIMARVRPTLLRTPAAATTGNTRSLENSVAEVERRGAWQRLPGEEYTEEQVTSLANGIESDVSERRELTVQGQAIFAELLRIASVDTVSAINRRYGALQDQARNWGMSELNSVLGLADWSEHSPEEITGVIERATNNPRRIMLLIICYVFISVQETGRISEIELSEGELGVGGVRHTRAASDREFEEGVARLAEPVRHRLGADSTGRDWGHSARSNSPSPESANAGLGHQVTSPSGSEVRDYMRDCPHHLPYRSDMTCNNPTHLHKSPHRDDLKTLKKSSQHGEHPRPRAGVAENIEGDTWEISIEFEGCKHQNRVFVEKLDYLHDSSIHARCGCNGFDKCLVAARRAISRQMCLICRTAATKRRLRRASDGREPFSWFDRYVKQAKSTRTVQLWPFDAND